MKEIVLDIEEKNVTLIFKDGDTEVAREEWLDENNLQETFFQKYDAMLENQPLFREKRARHVFSGDLSKGYTTMRIGKTIMSTLQFASENS